MKYIFALVLIFFASAQAITLKEVIELAKKRSLQIKITEEDLKKVYQQIREVKSNIFPHFVLDASYQKFDPNYITGLSLENRYRASVQLKQKLFDKTVFESLKVAKENVNLQKAVKKDTEAKVVDTAKRLYIGVLYYKEVLSKEKESFKYWQKYFNFVENQFKAGLTNKYNFYRAKAQLSLAKAKLKKAQSDYKKAIINLKRFLYLGNITEPEENFKIISLDIPTEENLKNNTQLKVIYETMKVKEREKDFYRASNFPKLNLNLAYETYNTRDFPSLKEAWRKGYIITVSLNWDLFDGFKTDSKVMQSQIDKIKEKLKYEDKLNELKKQYENTLQDLKSLLEQAKAYEENIKASKEALHFATERYKYGLSSIVDVLEAEKNYHSSQIEYAGIIYKINLKIFDLQLLTGEVE